MYPASPRGQRNGKTGADELETKVRDWAHVQVDLPSQIRDMQICSADSEVRARNFCNNKFPNHMLHFQSTDKENETESTTNARPLKKRSKCSAAGSGKLGVYATNPFPNDNTEGSTLLSYTVKLTAATSLASEFFYISPDGIQMVD